MINQTGRDGGHVGGSFGAGHGGCQVVLRLKKKQ